MKRGRGFGASPAQRQKVRDEACVVCGQGPVHPAHVIDRSLGGCDHPDCVVPLCPGHHRAYDEYGFDLVAYLEPRFRVEQMHAVGHLGLSRAIRRVTNGAVQG